MIKNRKTFFLGIFILIIPFLGLPTSWKTILIVLAGFSLSIISVKVTLPRKTVRSRPKREKVTPVFVENTPLYPKDETVEMKSSRQSIGDR